MKVSAVLEVNGKEIKLEIPEEEITKLIEASEQQKKTGYERSENRSTYYCIDYDGQVTSDCDCKADEDNSCYETANYYSDKTVAENNARADALMRKLRRFAIEHRTKELDWNYIDERKYFIAYDHGTKRLIDASNLTCQDFGKTYFDSKETAKAAIEEFKDELLWYFTEYKDSL